MTEPHRQVKPDPTLNITPITLRRPPRSWLNGSLLVLSGLAVASHADSLDEALRGGTPSLEMRLRYESVDDSRHKDAGAATLRTRLGYRTAGYHGLSAYAGFVDVRAVLGIDDSAPKKSGYATVADPEVTRLNQAFLAYAGRENLIRLGRQRLILDNARFVGHVGWRQNEQTFDAVSFVNTSLPGTTITYAFLDRVNGVLSRFDADVSDYLLNLGYEGFKAATLTGYAYLLEDNGSGAHNDTYGFRVKGKTALAGRAMLLYTAEFATQSTYVHDATYGYLEAGMIRAGVTARLGYEVLGSDGGGYGFQTPLATKHAFNGWADNFLSTPVNGLQDLMLSVGGKVEGTGLLAVYHDFRADKGGAGYGTELDLQAVRVFGTHYTLGLKYAGYNADTWKTDTRKLWIWGQLRFD